MASSETGDSRRIRGVNAASGRQFSSIRSTFSRGHAASDSLKRLICKNNTHTPDLVFYVKQEIRSVELGVCPMQLFHF